MFIVQSSYKVVYNRRYAVLYSILQGGDATENWQGDRVKLMDNNNCGLLVLATRPEK